MVRSRFHRIIALKLSSSVLVKCVLCDIKAAILFSMSFVCDLTTTENNKEADLRHREME